MSRCLCYAESYHVSLPLQQVSSACSDKYQLQVPLVKRNYGVTSSAGEKPEASLFTHMSFKAGLERTDPLFSRANTRGFKRLRWTETPLVTPERRKESEGKVIAASSKTPDRLWFLSRCLCKWSRCLRHQQTCLSVCCSVLQVRTQSCLGQVSRI